MATKSKAQPGPVGRPAVDAAEEAMLAVAAGDVDEAWLADWLRERVRF